MLTNACYFVAFENPSRKKPFLGLDLLYMYSLLHDGYRLRSKTKLHVSINIYVGVYLHFSPFLKQIVRNAIVKLNEYLIIFYDISIVLDPAFYESGEV